MKFDHASVMDWWKTSCLFLFVIKVPAAVTAKAPCLQSPRAVAGLLTPRATTALASGHGDAAAAALVQPHEWCNGAGGAALLCMVVRDDWLAPSAPGTT